MDTICGGRQQIMLRQWIHLLDTLKATGCILVFFSDLNIQVSKVDEWINRRNEEFVWYVKLYDCITSGKRLSEIARENGENAYSKSRSVTSVFYGMAVIAKTYGDFFYSTKHEADVELAQYAKQRTAMAIVSDDTDFLIFDGPWRLWSAQSIRIDQSNRLKTNEYDRNGIANVLSLPARRWPLFATLMGNDFTKPQNNELFNFYKQIGNPRSRIRNIARFCQNVRQDSHSGCIPDAEIRRIAALMCGSVNVEMEQLIKESLDSYNTDFLPQPTTDPIEAKLLHTNMYRPYMGNLGRVHGITLPFYDLRGYTHTNLTSLLTDWIRHRKGIVCTENTTCTFTLLAKTSFHEPCKAHTETWIRPNCMYDIRCAARA